MERIIIKATPRYDELYHHGVKGQKGGHRKNTESSVSSRKRIIAKRVAIGVAAVAAVAGVSYVAVTMHNNKAARKAVDRVLRHNLGFKPNSPVRKTHMNYSTGVRVRSHISGHSGRQSRYNAHMTKALNASSKGHDRAAKIYTDLANKYPQAPNPTGKIPKLRRQSGPKILRY